MKKKYTKRNRRVLVVGSWNVRTLVECSCDVRVCRKRQVIGERSEVVDRKLDLLVGELKRYGVSVAGVQESMWFGRDVWPATGGCTFLHSGRLLPNSGDPAMRNEGVGILLDEKATAAWRQGGEVWEVVRSRVVMARLKWIGIEGSEDVGVLGRVQMFLCLCCVHMRQLLRLLLQ